MWDRLALRRQSAPQLHVLQDEEIVATDPQSYRDGVIIGVATTIVGGVVIWLLRSVLKAIFVEPVRTFRENRRLRRLLLDRCYRMTFNPASGKRKPIGFAGDGQITDGQNENEHSWRVRGRKLEIFGNGGHIYSRFRYDAESDSFVNSNDPDTSSIRDQYIKPVWERAGAEQAASQDGESAGAPPPPVS